MLAGKIESVRIGTPKPLPYRGKMIQSAIFKEAVQDSIYVSSTNLEGDVQADTKHHGGPDKAVCAYAAENYSFFTEKIGQAFPNGSFGENLTTIGLREDVIMIGDIFSIGECTLQVSQPREPCYKIAARHKLVQLPVWIKQTGYTGYYFRVLKEGILQAGDSAILKERGAGGITVAEANAIMYSSDVTSEQISRLLIEEALSASWRKQLTKKLASHA
ncbi:MOSC domain-containing protein [Pradoshia sp.]